MRIALPHCYPIVTSYSTAHWKPDGTQHGPKSNPRVMAATYVKLRMSGDLPSGWCRQGEPTSGHRLWFYFRGGYAFMFEWFIDRRPILSSASA